MDMIVWFGVGLGLISIIIIVASGKKSKYVPPPPDPIADKDGYCMADGTTCWSDAMCSNHYCKDNWGGMQRGTCRPNT